MRALRPPRIGQRPEHREADAGFTVVEVLIAALVMTIVFAIAGAMMVSLSNTASRNETMVANEQAANLILAQIARDIRSAATVSIPAGSNYTSGIQLTVITASGGSQQVEWVYNPTTGTLIRNPYNTTASAYQLSSAQLGESCRALGMTAPKCVQGVDNTAQRVALFSYFGPSHDPLTSTSAPKAIQACTTEIGVDLLLKPTTSGMPDTEEKAAVAVTNVLDSIQSGGTASSC